MKKQSVTSLTALPTAPDVERRNRMIKYSVAMGIRLLCLLSLLFVHGWWIIIPALIAIFIPYFAVVIANVGPPKHAGDVERPGSILPVGPVYPAGSGQTKDDDKAEEPRD